MEKFKKAVLPNGLTLVGEEHPEAKSVSLGLWVRVGSQDDPPKLPGLSHFVEHMMFKGTERRTAFEIATSLESVGGDLNAFTDREFTCYHATVLSENLPLALDVLSDLMIRPVFPEDELTRERKVLLQELSMVMETPDDRVGEVFFESVFGKTRFGHSVLGNKTTMRSAQRADLRAHFKKFYRAKNMVLSVAGNFQFQELYDLVAEHFRDMHDGPRDIKKGKDQIVAFKPMHKKLPLDSEQVHLMLGYPSAGIGDRRKFDALVLSFYLGAGMSSRLFQQVREKAGLAYTIDCDCVAFLHTGVLVIYAAMAPESVEKCLDILGRELLRLTSEKLTAVELARVKGQLRGTILLSNENMEVRQEAIGRNEIIFGRYVPIEEVIAELEAVDEQRVLDYAAQIFRPKQEGLVLLGRLPKKLNVPKSILN